jgi:hypothetical protein
MQVSALLIDLPIIEFKHLTEIFARNCRIKPFPESKNFNQDELERLAIMTADSGLTDEEALDLLLYRTVIIMTP